MSKLLETAEAPAGVRSVTATYEKRLMLTAGTQCVNTLRALKVGAV